MNSKNQGAIDQGDKTQAGTKQSLRDHQCKNQGDKTQAGTKLSWQDQKNIDHRDTYKIRFILGVVFLIVFFADLAFMLSGNSQPLDDAIGAAVRSLRNPVTIAFFIPLTNMASWKGIVAVAAAIIIADLLFWKRKDVPVAVGASLLTLSLYQVIKSLIGRPRPARELWLLIEHGTSFPSGHTMNGVFCYGIMLYLILRSSATKTVKIIMTVFMTLFMFLIGFSRIFVGVHYFSDVVGGASLALSLLMFFTVAIDEIRLRYLS